MEKQELINHLQQAILNIFPESGVHVSARKSAFYTEEEAPITVRFTLGKDKAEYSHGYAENDDFNFSIDVEKLPDNKYQVDSRSAQSFSVTPDRSLEKEKYLAYGSIKTGWKNFKTYEESVIIDKITKFFLSLKQQMKEHKARLTKESLELAEKKGYLK